MGYFLGLEPFLTLEGQLQAEGLLEDELEDDEDEELDEEELDEEELDELELEDATGGLATS
jgi:hypothetical protein